MATACVHVMSLDKAVVEAHVLRICSHINIGAGVDMTIRELAETIGWMVGFIGRIVFDPAKPDGTPVKRHDLSRLHALGWKAPFSLEDGLRRTYED